MIYDIRYSIFGGVVIRMFTAAAHASWYRVPPQAQ